MSETYADAVVSTMVLTVTIKRSESYQSGASNRGTSRNEREHSIQARQFRCWRSHLHLHAAGVDACLTYLLPSVICSKQVLAPVDVRNAIDKIIRHLRQRLWRADAT